MDKIEQLKAGDLKELLYFLNLCFKGDPYAMHFEKGLPKLWVDDDEHMGKHYAVKENGKIIAVVGIYVFDTFICGEKFRFATVGNVASAPECRGRGYLHNFYIMANDILEKEGVDVARLGGKRDRYERYGYEPCGGLYKARIDRAVAEKFIKNNNVPDYKFVKVTAEDTENLKRVKEYYELNSIKINRGETLGDFYLSTSAWDASIYMAFDGEEPVGYLLTQTGGDWCTESYAKTPKQLVGMISRFLLSTENTAIRTNVPPDRPADIALFDRVCLGSNIDVPSHFKILNREKLTNALLKLGNSLTPYMDGEVILGVEGEGNYLISVKDGIPSCEKTEKDADLTLPYLDSARLMFGPMPPYFVADLPKDKAGFISQIFPLPLYWNNQDRA